jgi:hypothetical protein
VNAPAYSKSTTRRPKEVPEITAIVLYDLPPDIGLEECRAHFTKIAPDFLLPGRSRPFGLGLDELVRHCGGLMRKSAQTKGQCKVGMTRVPRLGS